MAALTEEEKNLRLIEEKISALLRQDPERIQGALTDLREERERAQRSLVLAENAEVRAATAKLRREQSGRHRATLESFARELELLGAKLAELRREVPPAVLTVKAPFAGGMWGDKWPRLEESTDGSWTLELGPAPDPPKDAA